MPTPRFANRVIAAVPGEPATTSRRARVSQETVESEAPDGQFVIRGMPTPVRGRLRLVAGDEVAVQWKGGKPSIILDYAFHKAGLHDMVGEGGAVVEELFVGRNPKTGIMDVIFRNFEQITGLHAYLQLPAAPVKAFWGVNPDVFAVLTGTDTYHVFRLKRARNKILRGTPTIKEKLYSVTLSDTALQLTQITLELRRNSIEPVVETDWSNHGQVDPFTLDMITLRRDTNVNQAQVDRVLKVKLKGATSIVYEGTTVDPAEIVVNGATASLLGAIVNEANELVFTSSIVFNDFGVKQGNPTTGLTGDHQLINSGVLVNGGIDFVPSCPFVVDDLGVQGFNANGNVGGVTRTRTTETHVATVNAVLKTLVWTTLASNLTLRVVEDHSGLDPYPIQHFDAMPVINPQCWQANGRDHVTPPTEPFTTTDFGNIGKLGITRSDRDLFSGAVAFAPDPTDRRTALILTNDATRFWYDEEPLWAFPGFSAPSGAVKVTWNVDVAFVADRYQVFVSAVPFWSTAGQVLQFIGVLRQAQNPPGYGTDQDEVGAFVLIGTGAAAEAMPYTTFPAGTGQLPKFLSGNPRRVTWSLGSDWYMTDFADALPSKKVGSDATDAKVKALALVNQDLLYATLESELYFVKGWKGKTITLNQSAAGFPPKDPALATAGKLKKGGVPYPDGSFHVIEDPSAGIKFQ